MGITQKSLDRLNKYNCLAKGVIMLELGAQNLYDSEHYGMVAKDYFQSLGVIHYSVDIVPHQGSVFADLRTPWDTEPMYGCITNFGTTEHVDGSLWQAFKNIHNCCCVDGADSLGLMIHENPKTGNWPQHGHHYMTEKFYQALAVVCEYELLEVTSEPAMGNYESGWNVCAVLRKTKKSTFPDEELFNILDFRKS